MVGTGYIARLLSLNDYRWQLQVARVLALLINSALKNFNFSVICLCTWAVSLNMESYGKKLRPADSYALKRFSP